MKPRMPLLLALSVALLAACNKPDDPALPSGTIVLDISNTVDDADLALHQVTYTNLAGNAYKVSHLEYYLSDFRLLNANFEWVVTNQPPVLINAKKADLTSISLVVPNGIYTGFACTIGLPETMNTTGSLYPNVDNLNMAWPVSLGGGYHFMKFEGYYLDSTQVWRGFTVHLGQNGNQAINVMYGVNITVDETARHCNLTMNLNEWFQTPHLYDFNVQGNYTMAVDSLMVLVSENGIDAIQIK